MIRIANVYTVASTPAEFATLLGMNYNAEDSILYKGTNSRTGFKVQNYPTSASSSLSVTLNLCVNGVTVANTTTTPTSGPALYYEKIGDDTCVFNCNIDLDKLAMFYSKFTKGDGSTGWCYCCPLNTSGYQYAIVFDDEDNCAYIPYATIDLKISTSGGTTVSNHPIIDTISLAPLIVQMNESQNYKKIHNVYMASIFPYDKRTAMQEFTLNSQRYISMCGTTTTSNYYLPLVVKGNNY